MAGIISFGMKKREGVCWGFIETLQKLYPRCCRESGYVQPMAPQKGVPSASVMPVCFGIGTEPAAS